MHQQQIYPENPQINAQYSQGIGPGFSQPQNYDPLQQQPIGFQQQPIGFQQQPIGFQQQPMDFQQQPMGFQQQPIGFQQQPIGMQQIPVQSTYQPIPQQNFQPMPGPQNYNPTPQVVIVQQNQEDKSIPVNISNSRASSYFRCLKCGFKGMTKIEYKMGSFSWMMVIFFAIFFFPFACMPCCITGMQDVIHHCPQCEAEVGRVRMGQPPQ